MDVKDKGKEQAKAAETKEPVQVKEEKEQAKVEEKKEPIRVEEKKEQPEKEKERTKEEEYLDHLKRLQAEFENYKKRTQKEKEGLIKHANTELILEILKIIDDFERALPEIKDEHTKKGMAMIYERLMKILKEQGVSQIPSTGKFDPAKHEVIIQVTDTDKPDGEIVDELKKGYYLGSMVIRPSVVSISKKEEEKK